MRNLIRRKSVKRLFVSKPEIKQTSDKVNITVYIFNRERQFFLRKIYFYNRKMLISKNVFFYKLWLKKNLLAFKKTFKNKKSIIPFVSLNKIRKRINLMTKRRNQNKTYIHNILLKNAILNITPKVLPDLVTPESKKLWIKEYNKAQKFKEQISKHLTERKTIKILQKSEEKKINLAIPFIMKKLEQAKQAKQSEQAKQSKQVKQKNLGKLVLQTKQEKIALLVKFLELKKKETEKQALIYIKEPYTNYFVKKITRKTNYKLKNYNSIYSIVKKRKKQKRSRFKKIRLPYSNFKFENEIKFFSFKLISELKYIRKLFKFYFIKYLFYSLGLIIGSKKVDTNLTLDKSELSELDENKKDEDETRYFYITKNKSLINVYNLQKNLIIESDKLDEVSNYLKTNKKIVKKHIKTGKLLDNKYYIKIIKKNIKIIKFKNKYSYDKLKNIEQLNLELLHFLKRVLFFSSIRNIKNNKKYKTLNNNSLYAVIFANNNEKNIENLFIKFKNKYFSKFLSKFFKKEFLYINYYSKLLINQLKFGKFLPGLKILISKIYSKKVELNLVNLKYPQLNTDIYTEAIATKLKRKVGLLKVLKWALSLAKLPSDYRPVNEANSINRMPDLTIYKSLNINGLSEETEKEKNLLNHYKKNENLTDNVKKRDDRLDAVLNKIYPSPFVHTYSPFIQKTDVKIKDSIKEEKLNLLKISSDKRNYKNKQQQTDEISSLGKTLRVLNTIKYKWISGIRLEAAGRLTRRYTAAKSVYKYRYKGSLKNIDHSKKGDPSEEKRTYYMLRNHVKSNSQYSFNKSKRRIGAYGVKAWLAGY